MWVWGGQAKDGGKLRFHTQRREDIHADLRVFGDPLKQTLHPLIMSRHHVTAPSTTYILILYTPEASPSLTPTPPAA